MKPSVALGSCSKPRAAQIDVFEFFAELADELVPRDLRPLALLQRPPDPLRLVGRDELVVNQQVRQRSLVRIRALLLLLAFIPFVWGLGVLTAAMLLTFRRGTGFIGFGAVILGLLSGVYFPLTLLPGWLSGIAENNPVGLAIQGMRDSLLGGAGFSDVAPTLGLLVPFAALSLAVGIGAFRLAVRLERRRGTLGLY